MSVRCSGFTLVELMVSSAVLMIFFSASAVILQTGLQSLGEARVRSAALRLAQERIEMAENLAYIDVGTVGGIPPGTLSPVDTVTANGLTFTVKTSVIYIDDPYDNSAPQDIVPADYKRVRVLVTWNGMFSTTNPVVLLTDIAPKGVESLPGTGTLSVLVFDAHGQPLESANVHIEADSVTPPVMIDAYTDTSGSLILPGAPVCTACYYISVSKNGYTTDRTYGTNEVANPLKPHLSVLEAKLTQVSFAIDKAATMVLKATRGQSSGYSAFSGVKMNLQGAKMIGHDVDGDPVYKTFQQVTTGSGGTVTVPNLEWDSYTISIPSGSSVDFAGSWPFNPITLNPGETVNFSMIVQPAAANTLLIQLTDETHQPLNAAMAQLSSGSFIATQSSGLPGQGDWSQIFFTNLTPALYNLFISGSGYATTSATISVLNDTKEYFMMATASASP